MNKILAFIVISAFLGTNLTPISLADEFRLPAPGVLIHLSPQFNPPILKGIKVHQDNPFRFDFILDKGDKWGRDNQLKEESLKLVKYFLASLTVPENDLWVNLSPYEKDRIIPSSFGLTSMGRDLLAEDYMLKQITASLIYPEDEIGKKFWKRIYEEAKKKFGTTNIPVNTFNKVWIIPEKAVVFENLKAATAYVVESKLKVMLEQDYLSLEKHQGMQSQKSKNIAKVKESDAINGVSTNQLGSQIVREIVIPELTKEVNENKNFAQLRQVYNSLILATWYKKKIRDNILSQVYIDKNKLAGINISNPLEKEKIYKQYLMAFKKGVFNYIKEDRDLASQDSIPRKYFSGGMSLAMIASTNFENQAIVFTHQLLGASQLSYAQVVSVNISPDNAMLPVLSSKGDLDKENPERSWMRNFSKPLTERLRRFWKNGELYNALKAPRDENKPKPLSIYSSDATTWYDYLNQGHWHEGVDWNQFFGRDRRVLVLGDTNHNSPSLWNSLLARIPEMKNADVSHLLIEAPEDLDQEMIEVTNFGYIPHIFAELVQVAKANGIEVEFIDLKGDQKRQLSEKPLESAVIRGQLMGARIAQLAHDKPDARVVSLIGYGHTQEMQVPLALETLKIGYTMMPIVVSDQKDVHHGEQAYNDLLGVVSAVLAKAEKFTPYGIIDLRGANFQSSKCSGIIILPLLSSKVEEEVLASLKPASFSEFPGQSHQTDLIPAAGVAQKAFGKDYILDQTPDSKNWLTGNSQKIIDFVSRLEEFSWYRRLYLAVQLMAYARSTGKYSLGGNIVYIGYRPSLSNPQQGVFEINTFDHYGYLTKISLDAPEINRREVSTMRLQSFFGFEENEIFQAVSIPNIGIKPSTGGITTTLSVSSRTERKDVLSELGNEGIVDFPDSRLIGAHQVRVLPAFEGRQEWVLEQFGPAVLNVLERAYTHPEVGLKISLLAYMQQVHPKRVRVSNQGISIYADDMGKKFLTTISKGDLKYTEREKSISRHGDEMHSLERRAYIDHLKLYFERLGENSRITRAVLNRKNRKEIATNTGVKLLEAPKVSGILQRTFSKQVLGENIFTRLENLLNLHNQIAGRLDSGIILEAKAQLRDMSDEDVRLGLIEYDDFLAYYAETIGELQAYLLKNKKFFIEKNGIRPDEPEIRELMVAQFIAYFNHLVDWRDRVEAYAESKSPTISHQKIAEKYRKVNVGQIKVSTIDQQALRQDLSPDVKRYLYFTGSISSQKLQSLINKGVPYTKRDLTNGFNGFQRLSKSDLELQILEDRNGLGAIIIIDVPRDGSAREAFFESNLIKPQYIHGYITQHDGGLYLHGNKGVSPAQASKQNHTPEGGIDFTSNRTPLEIQNEGQGINFNINPAMLVQLKNALGFHVSNITIQPLKSLSIFLGIN